MSEKLDIKDFLGGNCRYCGIVASVLEECAITFSYWSAFPFVCHKKCMDAGLKLEAFDCQVVDADCNDCKHFKRGQAAPKQVSRWKNHKGEWVETVYNPEIWRGHCLKFDKPTLAFPKFCTGHPCFEHRRA